MSFLVMCHDRSIWFILKRYVYFPLDKLLNFNTNGLLTFDRFPLQNKVFSAVVCRHWSRMEIHTYTPSSGHLIWSHLKRIHARFRIPKASIDKADFNCCLFISSIVFSIYGYHNGRNDPIYTPVYRSSSCIGIVV